jgi:hypothetical protein
MAEDEVEKLLVELGFGFSVILFILAQKIEDCLF